MGSSLTVRVVLDTNVVLSALLFSNGRLAWLRHAWQRHQLQLLVCRDTIIELRRVLAYPKFNLSVAEQHELIAGLLAFTEVVSLPAPWPDLPACRDGNDQVFLVLAHIGEADALVSGDADVLAMRPIFPFRIMTVEELAVYMGSFIHEVHPRRYVAAFS